MEKSINHQIPAKMLKTHGNNVKHIHFECSKRLWMYYPRRTPGSDEKQGPWIWNLLHRKKWLVKRTKNPEPDTYQPEKNRTEKRNRNPESVTGKNRIEKKNRNPESVTGKIEERRETGTLNLQLEKSNREEKQEPWICNWKKSRREEKQKPWICNWKKSK